MGFERLRQIITREVVLEIPGWWEFTFGKREDPSLYIYRRGQSVFIPSMDVYGVIKKRRSTPKGARVPNDAVRSYQVKSYYPEEDGHFSLSRGESRKWWNEDMLTPDT